MDPEIKLWTLLTFPTKYVIPKSLKFSHWPSLAIGLGMFGLVNTDFHR